MKAVLVALVGLTVLLNLAVATSPTRPPTLTLPIPIRPAEDEKPSISDDMDIMTRPVRPMARMPLHPSQMGDPTKPNPMIPFPMGPYPYPGMGMMPIPLRPVIPMVRPMPIPVIISPTPAPVAIVEIAKI
ncbi:uncharacterized protein LOC129915433 [Episyrphus balteatus]|uniref:uncharacterized protein LOC129915433 n=1 Tax=Episyrphus balteatus TaxID=286459 RepID=UPI0024864DD2|nr:uncharacterized protein LOC129915433 [Episyrphus balteatus]